MLVSSEREEFVSNNPAAKGATVLVLMQRIFGCGKKVRSVDVIVAKKLKSRPMIGVGSRPRNHIDETAGRNSFFSGLCASGWLTAAIVMRLRVESIKVKGGMIGAGVEEMRWTHPVRPEDRLRTQAEILDVRRSATRPELGVVRSRTTVFNQHNEIVMQSIVNWLAPLRNPQKAP